MKQRSAHALCQIAGLGSFLLLCLLVLLSGALYEDVFQAGESQAVLTTTFDAGMLAGFAFCAVLAKRRPVPSGEAPSDASAPQADGFAGSAPACARSDSGAAPVRLFAVAALWAVGASAAVMLRSGMLFSAAPVDLVAGDVLLGFALASGAWLWWKALSRFAVTEILLRLAQALGAASGVFVVLSLLPQGVILLFASLLAPAVCGCSLAYLLSERAELRRDVPAADGSDVACADCEQGARRFPRVVVLSIVAAIFVADLLMTLFPVSLYAESSPLFAPLTGSPDALALGNLTEPAFVAALLLCAFSLLLGRMAKKGSVRLPVMCSVGFFAIAVGLVTFSYHFPGGFPIGVGVTGQCIMVVFAVAVLLTYCANHSASDALADGGEHPAGAVSGCCSGARDASVLRVAIMGVAAMILADLLVTALYQVSAFDYMDFTVRTVFGGVGVLVLVALLLGPMSHVYKAVEKDREVPGGGEGLDRAPEASAPGGLEEYLEATVAAFAEKYRLSPREAQIVRLLSQGRDVPYIEQDLVLSKSTVKTHIRHIYEKTGVSSRQDLLDLLLNGSSPASE